MNFLLLLIAFNGSITTTYYPSATSCENALLKAIDLGKYKLLQEAKCINLGSNKI